jgi:hypothetical protein
MGSSFVRYFYASLTFLHWCMHIGWNSGSVWCSFSSFCARPGVLHDKGQILFFSLLHLQSCSEIIIQTLFLCDCSSELFEQLLFWGACFKFSYLCACVVLQPRYACKFWQNFHGSFSFSACENYLHLRIFHRKVKTELGILQTLKSCNFQSTKNNWK